MKVRLPRDDHRSRFVLEELDRWAGLRLSFFSDDGAQVAFQDGDQAVVLEPVAPLSSEEASDLLTTRFLTGGVPDPERSALSLIFHVLSGADEINPALRDSRDRYDDRNGLLGRLKLTDTLIVDVLADDVLMLLRRTWPGIGGLDRSIQLHVSHDVDAPFLYAFSGLRGLAKAALSDVRRSDVGLASLRTWFAAVGGNDEADPYFVFDWLMEQSEKRGITSTFYFIAGRSGGRLDGDYDLGSPRMRNLLKRVIERGHEIGLHPSYNAFRSLNTIRTEKDRLLSVASDLNWRGSGIPVRMHYLRFDPVKTPGLLDQSGFTFDSSLGLVQRAGFRRGTMREFRLWDWTLDRPTDLLEKPLMAMDATLYKSENEGLDPSLAAARLKTLTNHVRAGGGGINLLWHNNFFFSAAHMTAYERILGYAIGRPDTQAGS